MSIPEIQLGAFELGHDMLAEARAAQTFSEAECWFIVGFTPAGAQNDLERITKMAYSQVAVYGMNDKVGLVSFPPQENQFDKPFSNETAKMIDEEVRSLIGSAYKRTLDLLTQHNDKVALLAETLLDKEVRLQAVDPPSGQQPLVDEASPGMRRAVTLASSLAQAVQCT